MSSLPFWLPNLRLSVSSKEAEGTKEPTVGEEKRGCPSVRFCRTEVSFGKKSDFSIDHILNSAGSDCRQRAEARFEWLQCTRYKPPKLPRSRRKEGAQKRKLGRNPRIPFSSSQVAMLEHKFKHRQYLSSTDVAELSSLLQLSETRVKIWFQNRRARERRDKEVKTREDISTPSSIVSSSVVPIQFKLSMPPVTSAGPLAHLSHSGSSAFTPVQSLLPMNSHLAFMSPDLSSFKLC